MVKMVLYSFFKDIDLVLREVRLEGVRAHCTNSNSEETHEGSVNDSFVFHNFVLILDNLANKMTILHKSTAKVQRSF